VAGLEGVQGTEKVGFIETRDNHDETEIRPGCLLYLWVQSAKALVVGVGGHDSCLSRCMGHYLYLGESVQVAKEWRNNFDVQKVSNPD
jgi:hypothetical protein